VQKGSGKLLANFREIPSPCRKIAAEKVSQLKEAGIGGVYALGNTSEAVCQITVGLNRVGMVLLGGLSPVATVVEAGLDVENMAESGLVEFAQLKTFQQVMDEA
jgi:repressor of nif and glnA expression